ncbi:MAG: MFS transporter [Corynebacteriales bacterium]|nr:MFS transporter [Mycobacteriales bacterium]
MSVSAPIATAKTLVRDRLTWHMYAALAIWTYFLQAFSPSLPFLRTAQDTSATISGLHGLALAVGCFITGLIGPAIIGALGRQTALWHGLTTLSVSVIVMSFASLPTITLLASVCAGAGGLLACNVVAATLADHHRSLAPAALSESNALSSVLATCAPLVLAIGVATGAGWQTGLLSVVVLVLGAALIFGSRQRPEPAIAPASSTITSRNQKLPRAYWAAFTALVLCCSIESCFAMWSSDLLIERTNAGKGMAALTVTAIIGGLAVGRFVSATLISRTSIETLLYAALATMAVGFTIFWLSGVIWLSFAALFIGGVGIGPMYPLSMARTVRTAPHSADLAVNRTALGLAPGLGGGPFVIGMLVDAVGIANALLIVPVLIAAAMLAVYLTTQRGDEQAGVLNPT